MKKNIYNKVISVAILASGMAFTACQDDLGFEPIHIIPGNEIIFGATAHFEDGDNTTRTVYGDTLNNKVEINWVANVDRIQIASPHTTGIDVAEYTVTGATDANLAKDTIVSTATTLQRIGEAGLQWTNKEEYEFYAMYPSHNQLKEVVTEVADTETYGLKTSYDEQRNSVGTMVGYLPVVQDPKDLNGLSFTNNVCMVEPDMRFAYMVAKEHYTVPEDGVISEDKEKIQLNFSSLVTALQFDITANTIGTQTNSDGQATKQIYITDLTLYSASGNDVCGKFEYVFPQGTDEDIKNGKFKSLNETTGYNRVSMSFGEGIPLSADDAIDATFFLLPSVEKYPAGDLKLIIHYTVNGFMQTKTATINKEITARKKYYFKDMLMPPVPANVSAAVWFQALEPQILASQVSFPVAGNVFANATYGAPDNNHQQGKTLDELWNMGVRGFEIVTQSTGSVSGNLGGCQVMAAEEFCTGNGAYTFHKAFDELVSKLKKYPNETLIILATYMAKNDGYNPYAYVSNLFNYLQGYVTNSGGYTYNNTLAETDFVQITDTSTVAGIRGKIAIIVRPGDDERWGYEKATKKGGFANLQDVDNPASPYSPNNLGLPSYPTNGLTNQIPTKITSTWWNKVLCVWDWGAASYDVWDRRYGSKYARAAAFNDLGVSNSVGMSEKSQIEKYLYGSNQSDANVGDPIKSFNHSGNTKDNNFNNYGEEPTKMPGALDEFNYEHALSNNHTAYVQEWMRVIPNGGLGSCVLRNESWSWSGTNYQSLWVNWPSSIDEKKTAIKGLFNKAVETKGAGSSNLYINVLSGYYATSGVNVSLLPFKQTIPTSGNNLTLSNMGKGGDFQGLAFDLNTYVYNLLSAKPGVSIDGDETERLTQDGPWGLVVIDHIGNPPAGNENNDKSVDLVNLIMMNNFKFPLATSTTKTRTVAVSFTIDPADPSGEIH